MNAKQLDLFEYLKTQTRTESPAPMLALLEAVDGIRHNKFKVSAALESVADLLAGEPERKNTRFNQFAHRVGRVIKPELLKIDRAERVEAVRDAAQAQSCFEGMGGVCGSPSSLDELKEFCGVEI